MPVDDPPQTTAPVAVPPTPPTTAAEPAPGPSASNQPVEINENTDLSTLSTAQLYDLNQNFLNDLVPTRALIDTVVPMSALRAEYENGSPSFVAQIDLLESKGYKSVRRTRGDGDCFYRSIAFAYIQRLLSVPDQEMAVTRAVSILEASQPMLEQAGFQRMVFEDFYDVLVGLVRGVVSGGETGGKVTEEKLLEAFQSPEVSNSIVVYLRLLTSAQIRTEPLDFAPFLLHPELGLPMEPREFCEAFVEATGKEADHPQITALSRALQLNVDIAYLDGRSGTNIDFVPFRSEGNDEDEALCLLYRPGHYDLLPPPVKS